MNTITTVFHVWRCDLCEYAARSNANIASHLCDYFCHSFWIGVTCALIAFALLYIADRHKCVWNFFSNHLWAMFCITWLFGFMVYDVGMYTGEGCSLLWNAPMAILHAFGIFFLNSDVSEIQEGFHTNTLFMACFSAAHFLGAFVSMVFVIKHFGYNVIAGFKISVASYLLGKKDITYVFWGMNNSTYHLAESIKSHHGKDKNYRTIIVRTNDDNETGGAKNGMERLFNFLSLKNKDLNRLVDLDCYTTSTFSNLSTIDSKGNNGLMSILKKELNMILLCRLIKHKTRKELHIFFMSEDEETNIKSVANLKQDTTINEFITSAGINERKVLLYCHTLNNSIHRVVANDQLTSGIEIKVVDSSQLCVDLLKNTPELHPVNYVDIEENATVSSPFNSLVVGFGQVGVEAVRFLYEFGAFVKTGNTKDNAQRSDFHCDVVDKDMPNLAGLFVANAPAIKPSMPFKGKETAENSLITLHEMDCQSVLFYEKLESIIKSLNYVVIATGNDEMNISLGVRILRLAIHHRENLNHFRILVRVSQDESGHIKNIAEYYNRLWAAEHHKDMNDNNLRQKTIPANAMPGTPITLFGTAKEIYQYDYIVSDKLKEMAKKFKERYDASINELLKQSGKEAYTPLSWDEENDTFMQLNGEYAGYAPTFSNVMKLRRTQSQNFENCFHVHTKQRLAMYALRMKEYTALTEYKLFRKNNTIEYQSASSSPHTDCIIRVLDTLAQTEHLRWNASHEILGYQNMGEESFKDEAKLLHGCLKDWHELKTVTKSYDYNVVDVSLDIIQHKDNGK